MIVRDIMTAPAVTVHPSASIRSAMEILAEQGFSALPVVDEDGQPHGIVTEADVLRGHVHHGVYSEELHAELRSAPPPRGVAEVMTTEALAVDPWLDVAELVECMLTTGFRSVPVIERCRWHRHSPRRDPLVHPPRRALPPTFDASSPSSRAVGDGT